MATNEERQALKERAFAEIDKLRDEAVAIAKDIHAHPEIGWDTPRSAGLLMDYLEKHGLHVEKGVANLTNAFRASIPGRMNDGVGVALHAEFDALPGLGHACSHNLIGTISSTAAIAVKRVIGDHPGNVYVMGTPFEEGGGGKILMIEEGVFDVADVAMMWHGADAARVGGRNVAAGGVTYEFTGRPAHSGQAPHEGINAADAAMLTFAGVNALRQHVTPDVRIHGIIQDAGVAPNIVPEHAVVKMMARAFRHEDVVRIRERLNDCARGAALMTGADVNITEDLVYAERLPVQSMTDVVSENLEALGVDFENTDEQSFASADSGNVSQIIPYAGFTLAVDEKGSVPHTAEFEKACNSPMAYDALVTAAKVMAASTIDLLTDPERVEAIKAEHAKLKLEA